MIPEQLREIIENTNYVEFDIRICKIDLSLDLVKVNFTIQDTEGSGRT